MLRSTYAVVALMLLVACDNPSPVQPDSFSTPQMISFRGQLDNAQYQIEGTPVIDVRVIGSGQLTAEVTWGIDSGTGPGSMFLNMTSEDFSQHVGTWTQTSETTGVLTADVTTQTYHIGVGGDGNRCGDCVFNYTLAVERPQR